MIWYDEFTTLLAFDLAKSTIYWLSSVASMGCGSFRFDFVTTSMIPLPARLERVNFSALIGLCTTHSDFVHIIVLNALARLEQQTSYLDPNTRILGAVPRRIVDT